MDAAAVSAAAQARPSQSRRPPSLRSARRWLVRFGVSLLTVWVLVQLFVVSRRSIALGMVPAVSPGEEALGPKSRSAESHADRGGSCCAAGASRGEMFVPNCSGSSACSGGQAARSGRDTVRRLAETVAGSPCGLPQVVTSRPSWPPEEPAVLANLSPSSWWRHHEGDGQQEALLEEFRSARFSLSTFVRDAWLRLVGLQGEFVQEPVDVSLKDYMTVVARTQANIFLFVRHKAQATRQGRGSRRLEQRRQFFESLERGGFVEVPRNFTKETQIFAMDSSGTGHGMHRHKAAWLAQIAGRKVWWVAPPQPAEGSNEAGHPSFPLKNLSEEEGRWPCAWLLQEGLVPASGPQVRRCVQHPGQVMVLPADWWHMTCSLDDLNLAIGGQGD